MSTMTDDEGRCLRCGHTLDADETGHSDDCPWS